MSRARAVMVCGTTSNAGKSFLATALCRWYARQGLRVAPFKSQNMSNNARVVEAGEMGSAQYFQALAARAVPEVRMNPVLVKPEADTRSQVVLLGRVDHALSRTPWLERGHVLWPAARDALHALMADSDLVIIEGAGSPAEINLMPYDYVNMRVAREADAATIIVADIDRGGAFAHLFGTHQLLDTEDRALVRGFVLNKFRGDPALLAPGPEQLRALTGVPTIGVLPMWRDHGLPDEDGVFEAGGHGTAARRIAIVAYPRISNLDEFQPLRNLCDTEVRWVRRPAALADADLVILPGSKHVADDLAWLRATGMDTALRAYAGAGRPLLAICGGLQMLGMHIDDPHGVEGAGRGLGVLPLRTTFGIAKHTARARHRFGALSGPWQALSGVAFDAYEIRFGRTVADGLHEAIPDGAGWQRDNILAIYTHGLFENAPVLHALFGDGSRTLDDVFDGLADFIGEHIGRPILESLAAGAACG